MNLLIIEDRIEITESLSICLEVIENLKIYSATRLIKALEIIKSNEIDLIILDLILPYSLNEAETFKITKDSTAGLGFINYINDYNDIPIIILSGKEIDEEITQKKNVVAYISKRESPKLLIKQIEEILTKK